jgi:hypothetical protein
VATGPDQVWVGVGEDVLDRLLRSYMPYYNGVRLHSGIGYRAPIDYEASAR